MDAADITYSDLTGHASAHLTSARKAVGSMRELLVTHRLLAPSATVPEMVQCAIACDALRIRELPGQQEALGIALGDELARRLGWSWNVVNHHGSSTLGVVASHASAHAYPLDWVVKRLEGGGAFDDVPDWFERLVEACRQAEAGAARRR